jgi:putative glutamine amidotransferase
MLASLVGTRSFKVNSLHSQGIDVLAPGLIAEAKAPDGIIEAVSMPKARGFLFGAQWHPEWRYAENPVAMALFGAFGDAVRAHAQAKAAGARKEAEPAL